MIPQATQDRLCADCEQLFTLTPGQIEWFNSKGLYLPRRCEACRAERRRQAAASAAPPQRSWSVSESRG